MLYFVEMETFFVTRVKTGVTVFKNKVCAAEQSGQSRWIKLWL
jgi:hypothetical protein